jgi:hypothetical protein
MDRAIADTSRRIDPGEVEERYWKEQGRKAGRS